MYSRSLIALAAVLVMAVVACGSDDGAAQPGSSGNPIAIPPGPPTPTSTASGIPVPGATSTASPFDGVETHPLTRVPSGIPSRPGMQPTSTPGASPELEPRTDSFPVEGGRPFVEIGWNVPISVASEDQRALIELLARIPDTPENRRQLQLGDHALWRSQIGFELQTFDDGAEAFNDEFLRTLTYTVRAGAAGPDVPSPGSGPYLSGFTDYMSELKTFETMGFDQRNVDQTAIAAPDGPGFTEIIAGRYDPALAKRLLAECDCPQPDAVTSYGGYEFWSWGDGPRGDLMRRNGPPVFDHVGRGGHVLMTEDGLYRTLTVPLMERLIDTLNGSAPSLAESAAHRFMMDVMGANSANGITVSGGDSFAREVAIPEGEGVISQHGVSSGPLYSVSRESNRANALLAPLLLPYELVAMGSGSIGPRLFHLVVIVNEDEQRAVENALRLADRIVNSNSGDGLPWALTYPFLELSVSGRHLVARLFGPGPDSLRFNNSVELLFAHEGE